MSDIEQGDNPDRHKYAGFMDQFKGQAMNSSDSKAREAFEFEKPEGPGLPLLARLYTQGRYTRASVDTRRAGQPLTSLANAAEWRQKALLRQEAIKDLIAERDELRKQLAALQWAASQPQDAKAWAVLNEDGDVSMTFPDRAEALTYCDEGEQPVPLVFGGAAPHQEAEGWRTIESAPKDGTLVLLCCVGWPHSLMRGEPWPMKVGGMWKGKWDIFGATWTPTHWMPLPSPPSTQGGADA